MITSTLPRLAKPRAYLPPNLYSGAYLLSRHLGSERDSFVPTEETKNQQMKIYKRNGKFYTIPRVDDEPVAGYNWKLIGRLKSRDIYIANSQYIV